jgi:WD40 repeat protein
VAVAASRKGNVSPDGTLRATPGSHHEPPLGTVWHVTISEVATGRERATIRGTPVHAPQHSYARDVAAVIFSPDSRSVVTGQFDGRVCVWETGTGRLVRELPDHEKSCTGLAFTAGGKRLLTSSTDGALCIYESEGWTLRHTLEHKDGVTSFSPTEDGRRVVTCAGNTATVWSVSSGQPEVVVTAPGGALRCVAVRADGKRFAAGTDGEPETIWVWDMDSGQLRHTLTGDLKSVIGVAFAPAGPWLASGDAGKKVRLWRLPD